MDLAIDSTAAADDAVPQRWIFLGEAVDLLVEISGGQSEHNAASDMHVVETVQNRVAGQPVVFEYCGPPMEGKTPRLHIHRHMEVYRFLPDTQGRLVCVVRDPGHVEDFRHSETCREVEPIDDPTAVISGPASSEPAEDAWFVCERRLFLALHERQLNSRDRSGQAVPPGIYDDASSTDTQAKTLVRYVDDQRHFGGTVEYTILVEKSGELPTEQRIVREGVCVWLPDVVRVFDLETIIAKRIRTGDLKWPEAKQLLSRMRTEAPTEEEFAEEQCELHLFNLMSTSPGKRIKTKPDLEKECLDLIPGLTPQGFYKARGRVLDRLPPEAAKAWSQRGRLPKGKTSLKAFRERP